MKAPLLAALPALFLFTLLAAEAPKPPEKFLGVIQLGEGPTFAVMSSTESVLDGKATPYLSIPDETDLILITLDIERRVVTRVVYRTRKDT